MKRVLYFLLSLMIVVGLRPTAALADRQAEYQALNIYCLGFNKWNSEGRKGQYSIPSHLFSGISHYCAAVDSYNKLQTTFNHNQKRYLAGLVIGETGYILKHNPETHPHMPELFALRGRAQLLVNQSSQAEANFMKALQLDPMHVDAYFRLSTIYLDTNRQARATEAAKSGLAIDPRHRGLRRLAVRLGIKLEDLPPVGAPSATGATDEQPPQPLVEQPPPPVATPSPPAAAEATKAKPAATPSAAAPATQGTASNPWCRFCPEIPATDPPASTPATEAKDGL